MEAENSLQVGLEKNTLKMGRLANLIVHTKDAKNFSRYKLSQVLNVLNIVLIKIETRDYTL